MAHRGASLPGRRLPGGSPDEYNTRYKCHSFLASRKHELLRADHFELRCLQPERTSSRRGTSSRWSSHDEPAAHLNLHRIDVARGGRARQLCIHRRLRWETITPERVKARNSASMHPQEMHVWSNATSRSNCQNRHGRCMSHDAASEEVDSESRLLAGTFSRAIHARGNDALDRRPDAMCPREHANKCRTAPMPSGGTIVRSNLDSASVRHRDAQGKRSPRARQEIPTTQRGNRYETGSNWP
jgi:hypothetical protein